MSEELRRSIVPSLEQFDREIEYVQAELKRLKRHRKTAERLARDGLAQPLLDAIEQKQEPST